MAFSEKIRRLHESNFKDKVDVLYPDRLDTSNVYYVNLQTPVELVCHKHGSYMAKPREVLTRGMCCKQCALESYKQHHAKTFDDLVVEFREMHKGAYSYLQTQDYYNKSDDVLILCCEHGLFKQKVHTHRRGSGCRSCGYMRAGGVGGYTENLFSQKPETKDMEVELYVIKLVGCGETFYKVGLTKNNVNKRFSTKLPYNMEQILSLRGRLEDLFELEQFIISEATSYKPTKHFYGYTECFQSTNIESYIGELTSELSDTR